MFCAGFLRPLRGLREMNNSEIRGIIFDLDGTLYRQKPVRRFMFWKLLKHYMLHFRQWRQLYGLYLFRRGREKTFSQFMSFEEQLDLTAIKAGIDSKELEKCIRYWMFERPLPLISKYRNKEILEFLQKEQEDGKRIIIYSDYPVEQKLDCLHLKPDYVFYPGVSGIQEMKPSYVAMEQILNTVKLNSEELMYIGDRMDKDGESAKLLNISFILVHS